MWTYQNTYLLVKSIQLDDTGCSRQDLQLESLRGATPLGGADVATVQGEGITATRWAPTQTTLSQLAFSRLL